MHAQNPYYHPELAPSAPYEDDDYHGPSQRTVAASAFLTGSLFQSSGLAGTATAAADEQLLPLLMAQLNPITALILAIMYFLAKKNKTADIPYAANPAPTPVAEAAPEYQGADQQGHRNAALASAFFAGSLFSQTTLAEAALPALASTSAGGQLLPLLSASMNPVVGFIMALFWLLNQLFGAEQTLEPMPAPVLTTPRLRF